MTRDTLQISEQPGKFREKKDMSSPVVKVFKATSATTGTIFAYAFSELGVDKDGMPDAYGPPKSETDLSPLYPATQPKEDLKMGIRRRWNAFTQDDPAKTWEWVGPQSGPTGTAHIDERPFLRDVNGNFPIINQKAPYKNYYKTQTAIPDQTGNAVNARLYPFSVLNGLPGNGYGLASAGVKMGDYGIVFSLEKPVATPFIFADNQGDQSPAVKEFSLYVAEALGRNRPVGALVFAGSALNNKRADTNTITPQTILRVMLLNGVDNLDSLLERIVDDAMAWPQKRLQTRKALNAQVYTIKTALYRFGLLQGPPPSAFKRHVLQ